MDENLKRSCELVDKTCSDGSITQNITLYALLNRYISNMLMVILQYIAGTKYLIECIHKFFIHDDFLDEIHRCIASNYTTILTCRQGKNESTKTSVSFIFFIFTWLYAYVLKMYWLYAYVLKM